MTNRVDQFVLAALVELVFIVGVVLGRAVDGAKGL